MTLTPKQRRLLAELQAERAKAQPDPKSIAQGHVLTRSKAEGQ